MERKQFDSDLEHEDTCHRWYVSCDVLCVGDYGGAGTLGEANIRVLEKDEDVYIERDAYGRQLWLPDTPANRELIEGLENDYCILDEGVHSEVESEWELEAWRDYGLHDMWREMKDSHPLVAEHFRYVITPDELEEMYFAAREEESAYPAFEYSGACLPLRQIKDTFAKMCEERMAWKVNHWNHIGADTTDWKALLVLSDYFLDRDLPELSDYVHDLSAAMEDEVTAAVSDGEDE